MATCLHPFRLPDSDMVFRCGRCIQCQKNRANLWLVRLYHEASYHEASSFVTLTYDNDHIPPGGLLRKKDAQDYIKRLRKNTGLKLKYYLVGEFGERTHRPHYHIILFGISGTEAEIKLAWPHGNVHVGSVQPESMKYVSKYCVKAGKDSSPAVVLGFGAEPLAGAAGASLQRKRWMTCSQGLGLQWSIDNIDDWRESQQTTIGGKAAGIPRYYKLKNNVVSIKKPEWQQALADRLDEIIRQEEVGLSEVDQYRARQVKQAVFALNAKAEMSAREPG